jgi:hypothetical protein
MVLAVAPALADIVATARRHGASDAALRDDRPSIGRAPRVAFPNFTLPFNFPFSSPRDAEETANTRI